jgi:hypothetical protein
MVSLKLQKRLASSVMKCGKRKVWLDPNEVSEISMANSRQNIKKLVKDGLSSVNLKSCTLAPELERISKPSARVVILVPVKEEEPARLVSPPRSCGSAE